jgi:hypothetical protein
MKETILTSPMLNRTTYIRLNTSGIAKIKLDSYDKKELNLIEEITKEYISNKKEKIEKLSHFFQKEKNEVLEYLDKIKLKDDEIIKLNDLETNNEIIKLNDLEETNEINDIIISEDKEEKDLELSMKEMSKIKEIFFELKEENFNLRMELERKEKNIKKQKIEFDNLVHYYDNFIINVKLTDHKIIDGVTFYILEIHNFSLNNYVIYKRYLIFLFNPLILSFQYIT